jgi:RNA polymerase sigma-70 factor (ECF subfamily)
LVGEGADRAVVERVLAGDVEAYGILVRRHRDRMFRFALRMLGNREDAEEAVQDAFLRAYRSLANCDEGRRFDAWLYRIVANRCRTLSARRRRRAETFVADPGAIERAASPSSGDSGDAGDGWDAAIAAALADLPASQREAFLLKYVEERSYDEMAAIAGAGVSALKMRVQRAAVRLRRALADLEAAHVGR